MIEQNTEAFLPDVWEGAVMEPNGPDASRVAALMETLLEEHGAPRCREALARFVIERLPPGPLYIHGCGTHSRLLLSLLAANRPDIVVCGMLDRLATEGTNFAGLPVQRPEELTLEEGAKILVAHTSFEGEMVRSLLAAGIPNEKIIRTYSSRAFADVADGTVPEIPLPRTGDPLSMIVSCSNVGIVSDEHLLTIFPADQTVYIHMGRQDCFTPHPYFRSFDLLESVRNLIEAIRNFKPRVVYIRPIIYKNYLPALVKYFCPQTRVVAEYYDFTFLWTTQDLISLFGLDQVSIAMLKSSEYVGTRILDYILSKRGGPEWQYLTSDWIVKTELYFPLVSEFHQDNPKISAIRDFAYAGFLPSPKFLRQFNTGYNFLSDLQVLCKNHDFKAIIYNSGHTEENFEESFTAYYKTFSGDPIAYRGRIPYEELMVQLQTIRYGWLCEHWTGFQGDRHVGVCNRWTGYVSAGIPVLIDAGWRFMGALVRRFEAGIIVEVFTPDAIAAAVQAADHDRLRQGVKALRRHLIEHNEATMTKLAAIVAAGSLHITDTVP
ncbi:hypothetical protein [Azospirillum sp.]|uniref:hypothetical protein n=1 Tax=Azospirillum sp. TaxID=34012 RepID=UPI0026301543|nr:hypothetical protein [Azospirillum sp.]